MFLDSDVGVCELNIWKLIYRFSMVLLAILVVIGLICFFTPKFREYSRMQETRNSMAVQNSEKAEDIKNFKIKQERFTSEPAFVERTAREAGMVTSDEIVYKFKDVNGKVPDKN